MPPNKYIVPTNTIFLASFLQKILFSLKYSNVGLQYRLFNYMCIWGGGVQANLKQSIEE